MKRRALLCMAVLALAGCATPVPRLSSPPALPERYAVSGRVGVNADGKGYSAAFAWQHTAQQDRVTLSNPLGQTLAVLALGPEGASLDDGKSPPRVAADAESLTEQILGWRLPVRGLRYWLLGLADPSTPARWREEDGERLLEQDGWRIRLTQTPGQLPERLRLERPALDVKLVLRDWQLEPATSALP
jgi:outer membrane lipoprotein LolB